MKWSIGKKLSISFSLIMFIILAISAFSIFSAFTLNGNIKTLNSEVMPKIKMVNQVNVQTDDFLITTQKILLSKDKEFTDKYIKEIETIHAEIETSIKEYESVLTTSEGKVAVEEFKSNWAIYLDHLNSVIGLSNSGQVDQAIAMSYEANELYDITQSNLNNLITLHEKQAMATNNQGEVSFQRVVILLIAVSILSVIIISAIVVFFMRVIKAPVELLSAQAKELADGNLRLEPVQIKNSDEIGQLATDFNQMMLNLKTLVQGLQDHIQTVAATSEELSASAEETSKATEQITSAMVDVSEGADLQVQGAQTSNEAISEMVIGMEQASTSVQSVSDLAISTREYTTLGSSMMDETMQQMTNIQRSTETTSEVVHSLGEKSAEISQIVGLITAIADQTNLLALNAAIEAARAGEAGKGFAVVADEVRKLAEDSSVAANQIRDVIVSIQEEVVKAISAMEVSTNTVSDGINLVKKSEGNFGSISSMVQDVSSQTENISAVIEQLSANTLSIKGSIDEVATLSVNSSDKAQTVAAAAEEQNATMEEISASAQILGKLSSELQEMAHKFKL
ncbi:HAMP domain-containing methyl-accepting chemotaxis protein [Psychrobacillus sp.]|uniref:methyl-accepting chemotaxis protein n=1 Tax=Psychrobacillus sp. TaxID=1871623 RepID=UPI0028BD7B9D|nr:HAMP domain-containing methyl-accepting chemotaxis protein [Psychrobacillus sp.]